MKSKEPSDLGIYAKDECTIFSCWLQILKADNKNLRIQRKNPLERRKGRHLKKRLNLHARKVQSQEIEEKLQAESLAMIMQQEKLSMRLNMCGSLAKRTNTEKVCAFNFEVTSLLDTFLFS